MTCHATNNGSKGIRQWEVYELLQEDCGGFNLSRNIRREVAAMVRQRMPKRCWMFCPQQAAHLPSWVQQRARLV